MTGKGDKKDILYCAFFSPPKDRSNKKRLGRNRGRSRLPLMTKREPGVVSFRKRHGRESND